MIGLKFRKSKVIEIVLASLGNLLTMIKFRYWVWIIIPKLKFRSRFNKY